MILNGKGISLAVVYMGSLVSILFNKSIQCNWLFLNKTVSYCCEQWMTTLNVSQAVEDSAGTLLYTTYINMLCIVAVVGCIPMLSTQKNQNILSVIDCTHVGSATFS